MNTLVLHRPHWLASLLAWLRRPAVAAGSRRTSKPVVRIAGLR
jgi:hypothetical protein